MVASFYQDNQDMQFYVDKYIDWNRLGQLIAHGPIDSDVVQTYKDILDLIGDFVANEIAPRAKQLDIDPITVENGEVKVSPAFTEIFDQLKELGVFGLVIPEELGGMGCPIMLHYLANEIIARADVSIMTHYGFHDGIALALFIYCLEEEGSSSFNLDTLKFEGFRFEKEIAELISGETWGSMDITEPNAGSDMSAISTKAVQDSDGTWKLTGQKIFITSGHGKYHIVIARTSGDAKSGDLKGLSLFLVPAYEGTGDDKKWLAQVERVEHKIGHNASPTCTITYDETPGMLVGKTGDGFKLMLILMNSARLGVGFESIGVCQAALTAAKEYAEERSTMGKPISQHEMIADYLEGMETDTAGIRALAVEAALSEELALRYKIKIKYLNDGNDDAKQARKRLLKSNKMRARKFTPLLKYLAAEKSVELSRMCIQIHGGVGYTKEFGAEKLLRDALVLPIYEGTSQIQSLMVVKDALAKYMKKPMSMFSDLFGALKSSYVSRDELTKRVGKLKLRATWAQLYIMYKIMRGKFSRGGFKGLKRTDPNKDFSFALLNAERLTQIIADSEICEILFKQASKFQEREGLLRKYLRRAEPRARYMFDLIKTS